MPESGPIETGTIYDIGYRHYQGSRLGRTYAIRSLVGHDLRAVFAVGRGLRAMLIPLGLAAVAVLPAVLQAGVSAYVEILPVLLDYSNYFLRLSLVFALFCAARAPTLVCSDQRTNTLVLYFARALHRSDYAFAKLIALSASVFILALVPLLILFAGRILVSPEPVSALWTHAGSLAPIVGSSLLIALLMSSISLAIASRTSHGRLATAAVLGCFLLAAAVTGILEEGIDAGWSAWASFLNPFAVLGGFAEWIFGAAAAPSGPGVETNVPGLALGVGTSGPGVEPSVPGWAFGVGALAYIAVAIGALLHRYRRIDA